MQFFIPVGGHVCCPHWPTSDTLLVAQHLRHMCQQPIAVEAAEVVVEEPLEAVFFMTPHELTEVGSYFALQGPIYDSQGVETLLNVMLLERFALDGGAMPQPVVLRHFKRINRFNRRDSVEKPPRGCHVLKQLSLALARVPDDAQAQ